MILSCLYCSETGEEALDLFSDRKCLGSKCTFKTINIRSGNWKSNWKKREKELTLLMTASLWCILISFPVNRFQLA